MSANRFVTLLGCFALTVSAWADTSVPANGTLVVTNSEAFGIGGNLQLGSDATLVFGGASLASAGLNEYTRTNTAGIGTPNVTSYGTWTRTTTNAYWASTTITNASTEYVYTGRWHVPNTGLYSFFEYIDDADSITVDGATVLQSGSWVDATCVRNVSLTAGWHDLELRVFNGAASGGRVTNVLASGFLFSPGNDLISVANPANAFPFVDTGDGSSLLSVHNGTLTQKILVSGNATFDLSQQGLDAPLSLIGGLWPAVATNAHVTVAGGTGKMLFGGANSGINFIPFNADITFSGVADPAGVTFHDYSTVIAWPTSCPWSIADNATVALYGTNLLGTGDVTLTNFNIYVLSPYAVATGATIHVQGTNRTVYIKPCTIDTNGNWSGSVTVLTNSIALEGVNPTAYFPINVDLVLQGSISGTGTVIKVGSRITEIKASSFAGPVSVSETGTLIFDSSTAGDSNNTVTVGAGATFSLYPNGYGTANTTAWIKSLTGGGTTGKISLPALQTLTIDTFNGALTVQGSGSALCVNTLGTNASLVVSGQTAVTLLSAAPGATLVLNSGASLSVPSAGVTLDALTLVSGAIPVSGNLTVSVLGGSGKLVKQGNDTLTIFFSTNTTGVQIDAGKLTLASPSTNTVLGSLPAFWLDASASNVFTQYKSYAFTNGFINIERWNDCRPGIPVYGYNGRGNDNQQVYPYVMTNNQNGLPVVSMGSHQLTLSAPYVGPDGGGIEARRMPFSTNIYPQYAVMMFGSQNGGGAAVLGGNAAFYRSGSAAADFQNSATPILATAGYPLWTNGVPVVATTNTGFTGGNQILTVNTKGQLVNALGWRLDPGTAGGQNYGEVLFYTNALTTAQRLTAEAYLAKKWNLPFTCFCELSNVTVAAGATLEIGNTYSVAQLFGAGSVIAASGSTIRPSGYFTGSITLNSGAFSVTNLPVPPKASDISTAGLSCWFDPSVTNRIVFGGAYTPTHPLAVAALYDRTTTNRYLFGSCTPTDLTFDRRPWLSATNGPQGETQYWLDYSNVYGDSNGNTLRLYRNSAYIGTSQTGNHTPTNVQTAFIVLDSSRGGGVPITYDVAASSVFTRDNPQSASSPIWGSATAGAVKYGQTFLNGSAVNGATTGYSGTTELLSFVATNVVQAAFFGFYGGDGATDGNKNRERLGEIILFDSALTNTARADIEAYLMEKWLGKMHAGYSDFTAATVAGNGTVTAAIPQQLPTLAAGFSGTVALTANIFSFTLTTNAPAQYVVSPTLAFSGGHLSVAASGGIAIRFNVTPPPGLYPLAVYGTIADPGFANWTLVATGNPPKGPLRLKQTGTALYLRVLPTGTLMMFQ